MKYKRRKNKTSKYSYKPEQNGNTQKGFLSLQKKSIISAIVILTLFSLTRTGIISRHLITGIISSSGFGSEKSHTAQLFINKVGNLTREFCFGYIRNNTDQKTSAYADNEPENSGVQPVHNDKNKEQIVSSDSVLSESHTTQSEETTQHEPVFCPVMPCSGQVTSGYGERVHPITGEVTNHNGIDIGCNEGTPVKAVYDGIIETAQYNEYSGNYIVIRHINGFTSSYSHLSGFEVSTGQNVKCGDIIGYSGSTGRVTGPHLHLEIRANGNAVDPFSYIGGSE